MGARVYAGDDALNELAAAEKINSSYVSRLLRLTLLAPDIVESILEGQQFSHFSRANKSPQAYADTDHSLKIASPRWYFRPCPTPF